MLGRNRLAASFKKEMTELRVVANLAPGNTVAFAASLSSSLLIPPSKLQRHSHARGA
jgi:hypothetical protein